MTPVEEVAWYASMYNQHKYETRGFTLKYESETDDEVFDLKPVSQGLIDFLTNGVIKCTKPEELPQLKKNIAYLIGLRHRQQEAWTNKLADFETRLNNTKKWVQEHTR